MTQKKKNVPSRAHGVHISFLHNSNSTTAVRSLARSRASDADISDMEVGYKCDRDSDATPSHHYVTPPLPTVSHIAPLVLPQQQQQHLHTAETFKDRYTLCTSRIHRIARTHTQHMLTGEIELQAKIRERCSSHGGETKSTDTERKRQRKKPRCDTRHSTTTLRPTHRLRPPNHRPCLTIRARDTHTHTEGEFGVNRDCADHNTRRTRYQTQRLRAGVGGGMEQE
jgi:hypothetical protein